MRRFVTDTRRDRHTYDTIPTHRRARLRTRARRLIDSLGTRSRLARRPESMRHVMSIAIDDRASSARPPLRTAIFGVARRRQSYLNLLYLLVAFPLGTAYFIFL